MKEYWTKMPRSLIIVFMLALVMISGCVSNQTGEKIKIGAVLALSGPIANVGEETRDGMLSFRGDADGGWQIKAIGHRQLSRHIRHTSQDYPAWTSLSRIPFPHHL